MLDLVLPSPDALAARLSALSTERLVCLVRADSPGLSPQADELDAAAMGELAGRLPPVAYRALCDALA